MIEAHFIDRRGVLWQKFLWYDIESKFEIEFASRNQVRTERIEDEFPDL
jgi:hypothetical protein